MDPKKELLWGLWVGFREINPSRSACLLPSRTSAHELSTCGWATHYMLGSAKRLASPETPEILAGFFGTATYKCICVRLPAPKTINCLSPSINAKLYRTH